MGKDLDQYMDSCFEFFHNLPDKSFKHVACAICSDNQSRLKLFDKGPMTVYRCRCGFVYNGRQAKKEALDQFYKESEALTKWANHKETWASLKKQSEKFKLAVKLLEADKVSSVLDIGCGNGYFLSMFREIVTTVGTEVNEAAAQIARKKGIHVHEWNIDEMFPRLKKSNLTYDVVSLWGVLEHYLNPEDLIQNIKRILNPNGKIVICVPNVDSLVVKVLWEKCFTFCPQHLWYFNKRSLEKLLLINGFKVKHFYTIEPETRPILNHLRGMDPYANLSSWTYDEEDLNYLPDIIEENLGYKIVMIGELS